MCECITTCQHCGQPRTVCTASGLCVLGAPEVPSGFLTDDGHVIFEPYVRADATQGLSVSNPHGEAPWVLDVVAVRPAEDEGMVVLEALQGTVTVARDCPVRPRDLEDEDIEADVMLADAVHEFRKALGGTA